MYIKRSFFGARLCVLCAAIVLFGPVATAYAADNMYKTSNANWNCSDGDFGDGFCQTDNATLTVFRQASVPAAKKTSIKQMLTNQYAPTDLSIHYPSTASYTGDSETDIIYQVSASGFSGTTIGQTWCNDAVTSTKCDQEYVRFRGTIQFDKELMCHETGHAVGLTHGQDASPAESNTAAELGCMETPDGGGLGLGAHNKSEINATY